MYALDFNSIQKVIVLNRIMTWMNPWQVANNYTNPMQLENLIPTFTE